MFAALGSIISNIVNLAHPYSHILANHALVKEGGRTPPPYPSVFIKPSTSIAGFDQDIQIPKIAQDGTLDYEGELVSLSHRS